MVGRIQPIFSPVVHSVMGLFFALALTSQSTLHSCNTFLKEDSQIFKQVKYQSQGVDSRVNLSSYKETSMDMRVVTPNTLSKQTDAFVIKNPEKTTNSFTSTEESKAVDELRMWQQNDIVELKAFLKN